MRHRRHNAAALASAYLDQNESLGFGSGIALGTYLHRHCIDDPRGLIRTAIEQELESLVAGRLAARGRSRKNGLAYYRTAALAPTADEALARLRAERERQIAQN